MWSPYKRRIKRDLERWQSNGWVSGEGRAAILADVESSGRELGLAPALGILASILFGFAAISFVAAHWEDVPRLGRLLLLLALVWAGYGAAGWLVSRGHTLLADAAVLFSCGMFGASIMLISQMYNIGGNPSDGVLMWWIGTLFAGALLRSNPALALTMVLVCVWSYFETSEKNGVHWAFLIGWGLVTAAFIWQRWRPGLHLSALTLAAFVISLGYQLDGGHAHGLVAIIGALAAAAAVAAEKLRPDIDEALDHIAAPLFAYALAVAVSGLFALQFLEVPSLGNLIALATISLILILAAIAYALSTGNRGALWIGYIGFSAEILTLYGVTVGSILGTSLFFLIAAIIVSLLAYVALRLARQSASTGRPA
ncbi:DUF2157 domain-containing protein [Hyphomicrobium sp. 99]|uniref:DUF2157 domain-containing protein n=1 Tax=Hyphomicrobium sp. 99 TaxID=1163419 RepID=UPI0005F7D1C7|nr:DUF2157 domain-containing protein [Hyphomicrobium sp. 99]